jgi:hypothetical protein
LKMKKPDSHWFFCNTPPIQFKSTQRNFFAEWT